MHHEHAADHARRDHLTAILGYAQLLQRRITLCPNLTPSEREVLQQEATAIERAAYALRDLATPLSPPDAP
jgi:hypothetical protein